MKIVTLPNGFVLDLDSVHYIGSERVIKHPFSKEPTGKVQLRLYCEGNTSIDMVVKQEYSTEIQRLVLERIGERLERSKQV